MTAVATQRLDDLAVRVRDAHAEVEEHGRATVSAAIRAGGALIEAKTAVQHGEWLPWLNANFPAHRDTAALYMRMAANVGRVRHLASISEARAELTESRDPEPEPVQIPGQTDLVTEVQVNVPPGRHNDGLERIEPPAPKPASAGPPGPPEVVDAVVVPDEPDEPAYDGLTKALLREARDLPGLGNVAHPPHLDHALQRMTAADRDDMTKRIDEALTRLRRVRNQIKTYEETHHAA